MDHHGVLQAKRDQLVCRDVTLYQEQKKNQKNKKQNQQQEKTEKKKKPQKENHEEEKDACYAVLKFVSDAGLDPQIRSGPAGPGVFHTLRLVEGHHSSVGFPDDLQAEAALLQL